MVWTNRFKFLGVEGALKLSKGVGLLGVSIVSTALGLGGFQVSKVCQISVLRHAFHKTGKVFKC